MTQPQNQNPQRRSRRFFVGGAVVAVLFQIWLIAAWQRIYVGSPIRGYERAMRAGEIPPFFTTSPLARKHGAIVLASIAFFITLLARTPKVHRLLAFTAGLAAASIAIAFAYPYMRQSNFAPFLFIVIPLYLAVAVCMGGFCGWVVSALTQVFVGPRANSA